MPQDSFQEQARNPMSQQRHPEQMKPDLQGPTRSSSDNERKVKNTIGVLASERYEIETKIPALTQ